MPYLLASTEEYGGSSRAATPAVRCHLVGGPTFVASSHDRTALATRSCRTVTFGRRVRPVPRLRVDAMLGRGTEEEGESAAGPSYNYL